MPNKFDHDAWEDARDERVGVRERPTLEKLIELARDYKPTEAEKRERMILRAAEEREGKLRKALDRIRTEGGKVCAEYETCAHRSCSSSYASWAIADAALASAPTQGEGIRDTEDSPK